ncbi:MAG: flagellar biosynthesis protein FlhB [Lachnospiraceae bacterium]|nr:flagellar biosynthesis protein FlhB [Lachnospiraceae bacterium]
MILFKYSLTFFAEGQGGEKTEPATSKKLSDARKEGQVAKSKEVANCLGLLSLFIVLKVALGYIGGSLKNIFGDIYGEISNVVVFWNGQMPVTDTMLMFRRMIYRILIIILPVLAVGFIIAFMSDLFQVRWEPTTKPLQPKLSKINPISGFKRIFSLNSVIELLKSILKLGLIGIVAYTFVRSNIGFILNIYEKDFLEAIGNIGKLVTDLGIRISALYIVIAGADLLYQRWKFAKDMKMTKQEVKDEYKQMEGDPQIKGKIKQKMLEASRRRMMQDLPKADVVITNPTHYAVAIRYEPSEIDAPVVLAKGEGYLAQRIKDVARENNIHIVENKPLARMLYHNVDIGQAIPPELYQAVAEVLAFVYHLQGKV